MTTKKNTPYGESWQYAVINTLRILGVASAAGSLIVAVIIYLKLGVNPVSLGLTSFSILCIPSIWMLFFPPTDTEIYKILSLAYAGVTIFGGIVVMYFTNLQFSIWDIGISLTILATILFWGNTVGFACLYEWPYKWSETAATPVA